MCDISRSVPSTSVNRPVLTMYILNNLSCVYALAYSWVSPSPTSMVIIVNCPPVSAPTVDMRALAIQSFKTSFYGELSSSIPPTILSKSIVNRSQPLTGPHEVAPLYLWPHGSNIKLIFFHIFRVAHPTSADSLPIDRKAPSASVAGPSSLASNSLAKKASSVLVDDNFFF